MQHLRRHRAGQRAAAGGPAVGFIQADKHSKFGVFNRCHCHKAGNAGALILAVQLLAGAGFAAHTVARHGTVFAGAGGHNTLHQFAHDGAGFGPDDLRFYGGLHLLHGIALGIADGPHHMGLHQLAAVDHRADGCDHLQVAHLAALPEGAGSQLHRAHAVGGIVFAALDLARQVNTGCGAQAKGGKVIAKVLFAQPRPHLDKAGVAGYRQPLGQGFTAMDMPVCAAEICARHIDLARADKAAVPRDCTGIQCRSAGDELEHTAGFVQIGNCLVAPLGLLGSLQRFAAFFPAQGVHLLADGFIHNGARIVGVVIRLGGHGKDRAGIDLHHNAHRTGRHMMLRHGGTERAFQIVLDVRPDGQSDIISRHSILQGAVMGGHIIPPGIFCSQDGSVPAGQLGVILQFQPPKALIIHIGKAQQAAHKVALRVNALGILQNLDTLRVVLRAPGPHGIRQIGIHPAAEQAVVAGAPAQLLQGSVIINIQNFAQRFGGGLHQLIRQFPRGGPDGPAGFAGGQGNAIGGINFAAGGGQRGIPQLLGRGTVGVTAGVQYLQGKQPGQQPAKAQNRHQPGQHTGAPPHVAVLRRVNAARRAVGLFHGGLPPPVFSSTHKRMCWRGGLSRFCAPVLQDCFLAALKLPGV